MASYEQYKAAAKVETIAIEVETYGAMDNMDGVDIDETDRAYAQQLANELRSDYPDAEIEVVVRESLYNTKIRVSVTPSLGYDAHDLRYEEEVKANVQATMEFLFDKGDFYRYTEEVADAR